MARPRRGATARGLFASVLWYYFPGSECERSIDAIPLSFRRMWRSQMITLPIEILGLCTALAVLDAAFLLPCTKPIYAILYDATCEDQMEYGDWNYAIFDCQLPLNFSLGVYKSVSQYIMEEHEDLLPDHTKHYNVGESFGSSFGEIGGFEAPFGGIVPSILRAVAMDLWLAIIRPPQMPS